MDFILTINNRKILSSITIEKIFAILVLFLFTGALIPVLRSEEWAIFGSSQRDFATTAIWMAIYGVTILLLLLHFKQVKRFAFQNSWLWILIGLAILSAIWSDAPMRTIQRSLGLLGTTLFGIYLAIRYNRQELLNLLAWALGISAILSIIFVVTVPYGVHYSGSHLGTWKGLYVHKNIFGRIMGLGSICWLFCLLTKNSNRIISVLFLATSISLLLASRSITALMTFTISLLLIPVFSTIRYTYSKIVIIILLVVLIGGSMVTVVVNNLDAIVASFDRDITLTGRTILWGWVLAMLQQRLWLGYGYNAFWQGWEGPSRYIWELTNWEVWHSHNGYLDLGLQLGLVGLIIFIIFLLSTFISSMLVGRKDNQVKGLFHLVLLSYLTTLNFSESNILMENSIFWVLYVVIALSSYVELKRNGGCDDGTH